MSDKIKLPRLVDIDLQDGEEITEETLKELTNGKEANENE